MLLKFSSLFELEEITDILPRTMEEQLNVPMLALTVALIISMLSSFVMAMILLLREVRQDRKRDMRVKRLRYVQTGKEVPAPKIEDEFYHVFLSQ